MAILQLPLKVSKIIYHQTTFLCLKSYPIFYDLKSGFSIRFKEDRWYFLENNFLNIKTHYNHILNFIGRVLEDDEEFLAQEMAKQ